MKKFLTAVFIISFSAVLCLCGCSKYPKQMKLVELPQYENFEFDVDYVDVWWDVHETELANFVIDDPEQVDTITSMAKEAVIKNVGKEPYAGDRHHLSLVNKDGSKMTFNLLNLSYGGKDIYYHFQNSDITEYVRQIAEDVGVIKPYYRKLMNLGQFAVLRSDKNIDIIDSIEVSWDCGDGEFVNFSIDDSAKIWELIAVVREAGVDRCDGSYVGNTRSSLSLVVDGETVLEISLGVNRSRPVDGAYYKFIDDGIYDCVKKIGVEIGAITE